MRAERAEARNGMGTKVIGEPKACHCSDMNKKLHDKTLLAAEVAAWPTASPSTRTKEYEEQQPVSK